MGNIFLNYFSEDEGNIYKCNICQVHFTTEKNILSKSFNGNYGRAYLIDFIVNVFHGEIKQIEMLTGTYDVRDIYCNRCCDNVGWKYEVSYDETQKYKEGKYIIEIMRTELEFAL